MNLQSRWLVALLACDLLLISACGSNAVELAGDTAARSLPIVEQVPLVAPASEALAPANNDCWYFDLSDGRLVAVWVSPRLPGQVPGGFRFVNLIYHDAASSKPIALHNSPVHMQLADPVAVATGGLAFRAAPKPGKLWSDVVNSEDLEVDVSVR